LGDRRIVTGKETEQEQMEPQDPALNSLELESIMDFWAGKVKRRVGDGDKSRMLAGFAGKPWQANKKG
jgi:hypothetical protein